MDRRGLTKKYFVIISEGAYLKLAGDGQPGQCPTYFENKKAAIAIASRIFVGHLHMPIIQTVTKARLLDLASGADSVWIQMHRVSSATEQAF